VERGRYRRDWNAGAGFAGTAPDQRRVTPSEVTRAPLVESAPDVNAYPVTVLDGPRCPLITGVTLYVVLAGFPPRVRAVSSTITGP